MPASMTEKSTSVVVVVVALAMVVAVLAQNPLQDFCIADLGSWTHLNGYVCRDPRKATNEDFVYRELRTGSDTRKEFGGPIKAAFVEEWPALNTQGIAWGRIDYAVNGLSNLHWHPRSTEILYCQQGTLFVGFVDTNDRFWYNTLQAGDLALFPRGLLHFELNVGKVPALAQIAHNAMGGGIQREGHSTFGSYPTIPDLILCHGFDLDEQTVLHLKQFFRDTKLQYYSSAPVDHTEE